MERTPSASSRACAPPVGCTSATCTGRSRTGSSSSTKAECFFFVADWHALTTNYQDTAGCRRQREMFVDWLAAGLDPERCTLFVQSAGASSTPSSFCCSA